MATVESTNVSGAEQALQDISEVKSGDNTAILTPTQSGENETDAKEATLSPQQLSQHQEESANISTSHSMKTNDNVSKLSELDESNAKQFESVAKSSTSVPHHHEPVDYRNIFLNTYTESCKASNLAPNRAVIAASISLSTRFGMEEPSPVGSAGGAAVVDGRSRSPPDSKGDDDYPTAKQEKMIASNLLGDGPVFLLDNITVGPSGCQCLASALHDIPLTTLAIANAYANDEGVKYIANTVSTSFMSTSLVTISLRGNGIQDASHVSLMVASCPQLVNLDVAWNKMGLNPSTFMALCTTIRIHKHLDTLDMSNNLLTGSAVCNAIADIIGENDSITTMDLSWNNLMVDAYCIAQTLTQKNNKITRLLLEGNNLSRHDHEVIQAKIHVNERTAWELARQSKLEARISAALMESRAQNAQDQQTIEQLKRDLKAMTDLKLTLEEKCSVLTETYKQHKEVLDVRSSTAEDALKAADERTAKIQKECDERVAEHQKACDEATASMEKTRLEREASESAALEERGKLKGEMNNLQRERDDLQDKVASQTKCLEDAKDDYEKQTEALSASRKKGIDLEAENHRVTQEVGRKKAELSSAEVELETLRARVKELTGEASDLQEQLRKSTEENAKQAAEHKTELGDLANRHAAEKKEWDCQEAAKIKGLEEANKMANQALEAVKEELNAAREQHVAASMAAADEKQKDEHDIGELEKEIHHLESELHLAKLDKRKSEHQAQLAHERIESLLTSNENVVNAAAGKHEQVERQLHDDIQELEQRVEYEARRAFDFESQVHDLRSQVRRMNEQQRVHRQQLERRLMDNFQRAMRHADAEADNMQDQFETSPSRNQQQRQHPISLPEMDEPQPAIEIPRSTIQPISQQTYTSGSEHSHTTTTTLLGGGGSSSMADVSNNARHAGSTTATRSAAKAAATAAQQQQKQQKIAAETLSNTSTVTASSKASSMPEERFASIAHNMVQDQQIVSATDMRSVSASSSVTPSGGPSQALAATGLNRYGSLGSDSMRTATASATSNPQVQVPVADDATTIPGPTMASGAKKGVEDSTRTSTTSLPDQNKYGSISVQDMEQQRAAMGGGGLGGALSGPAPFSLVGGGSGGNGDGQEYSVDNHSTSFNQNHSLRGMESYNADMEETVEMEGNLGHDEFEMDSGESTERSRSQSTAASSLSSQPRGQKRFSVTDGVGYGSSHSTTATNISHSSSTGSGGRRKPRFVKDKDTTATNTANTRPLTRSSSPDDVNDAAIGGFGNSNLLATSIRNAGDMMHDEFDMDSGSGSGSGGGGSTTISSGSASRSLSSGLGTSSTGDSF